MLSLAAMTSRMIAGACCSFCAGIATFVRAEFFTRCNRTRALRMSTFLFGHDDFSHSTTMSTRPYRAHESLSLILQLILYVLPHNNIVKTGFNYHAATSSYGLCQSHKLSPCRPRSPYPSWCSYRHGSCVPGHRHLL